MSNQTNPDTIADSLLYLAQMMSGAGFHTDDADPILLRQAAVLISDQSETIGVLHTEHDEALADRSQLLSVIADLADVPSWFQSFYNDVAATTPEYFELCGDLNALMWLLSEAQTIRERANALLGRAAAAPGGETR